MAYVAVDEDGSEWIFSEEPYREGEQWVDNYSNLVQLPKGSIERLTGIKIDWSDNPIKLGTYILPYTAV